jgi:hypothetical protein
MSWENILKEGNIKTEFNELEDSMNAYNMKCVKIEQELIDMHFALYKKIINFKDKHFVEDKFSNFTAQVEELFSKEFVVIDEMDFRDILFYMRESVKYLSERD